MQGKSGIILRGIGGFYYVKTTDKIYECKLRGKFRKNKEIALVGDRVEICLDNNLEGSCAVIEKIYDRKNFFIRPPISNIDKLFIVVSTCDPEPNTIIIDELTALSYSQRVKPILIISKVDLKEISWLIDIYKQAKIKTILFSKFDKSGIDEIKESLKGCVSAFTGNSGVGKSTILNFIDDKFKLETNVTSKKLGRGKHTTRHVELLKLKDGGFVADTPGFSKLDFYKCIDLQNENLINFFPDLKNFSNNCKFKSCSHTCEKGCSVIKALDEKKISLSRYNSYLFLKRYIKNT